MSIITSSVVSAITSRYYIISMIEQLTLIIIIVMKIDIILVSFTMVANDTNNKHCIYVLSSVPVLSPCLYTISSPDYLICV